MYTRRPADYLLLNLDSENPTIKYRVSYSLLLMKDRGFLNNFHVMFEERGLLVEMRLDFSKGTFFGQSIFDIGNFEIINWNEWSGTEPATIIKGGDQSKVVMRAPAMLDIATVNSATGERVVPIHSSNDKDSLFIILNRINSILDYGRYILEPFRYNIDNDEPLPVDEIRSTLAHHKPRFKFTAIQPQILDSKTAESIAKHVDRLPEPHHAAPRSEKAQGPQPATVDYDADDPALKYAPRKAENTANVSPATVNDPALKYIPSSERNSRSSYGTKSSRLAYIIAVIALFAFGMFIASQL